MLGGFAQDQKRSNSKLSPLCTVMSIHYFCRQITTTPSTTRHALQTACLFTFPAWNTWYAAYVDRVKDRQQPSDPSGYKIPDRRGRKKTAALQTLVKRRNLSSMCTQMCYNIWTDGRSVMEKAFSSTSRTCTLLARQKLTEKDMCYVWDQSKCMFMLEVRDEGAVQVSWFSSYMSL